MSRIITPGKSGFSMWDLLLLVGAVTGMVLVVFPTVFRPRRCVSTPRIQCVNNLKQIGTAFRLWAYDHNDQYPMQVAVANGGAMEAVLTNNLTALFQLMSNELNTPKLLFCPADQTPARNVAANFHSLAPGQSSSSVARFSAANNLSYFVGVDAVATEPNRLLAGDDHLSISGRKPSSEFLLLMTNAPVEWRDERHRKAGNIGLADGAVLQLTPAGLSRALMDTGLATNRLTMP